MIIRKPTSHIRRLRKWLGYALYTLVLLIGFLYVLFPYQDVQVWSENQMEQRMGIHMQAKERKAGPFWFEWNELRLSHKHPSVINVLDFSLLHVNFHIGSILSQPLRFSSTFSLWDGHGEGWLTLVPDDGAYEYHIMHSFKKIQVKHAELPYIQSGRLSLDLDYQWNQNQPFFGQGRATFSFESVQIEDLPLFSDVSIPLVIHSADGLLNLEEAAMTVRDVHVRGEDFSFSGQGHAYLDPQILDSRVDGEGLLYLSQEFSQQFPNVQHLPMFSGQPILLKFSGTFRNPLMEWNGIPIPLEPALLFSSMSSIPFIYQ